MRLYSERTPVRQQEYFGQKLEELKARYGDCEVTSCGYGKRNISSMRTVTELTALAAGAHVRCPQTEVVLDIGGQDTKVVRQEEGKLKGFFVNEKCAAGSGLFLKHTLELLGKQFDMIDLRGMEDPGGDGELRLSSVCAVFAQSEIVELIAGNVSEDAIVRAVLTQILTQARSVLGKMDGEPVGLSGGLTQIPGIGTLAEQVLGRRVVIPADSVYLSAIGCAVLR